MMLLSLVVVMQAVKPHMRQPEQKLKLFLLHKNYKLLAKCRVM